MLHNPCISNQTACQTLIFYRINVNEDSISSHCSISTLQILWESFQVIPFSATGRSIFLSASRLRKSASISILLRFMTCFCSFMWHSGISYFEVFTVLFCSSSGNIVPCLRPTKISGVSVLNMGLGTFAIVSFPQRNISLTDCLKQFDAELESWASYWLICWCWNSHLSMQRRSSSPGQKHLSRTLKTRYTCHRFA